MQFVSFLNAPKTLPIPYTEHSLCVPAACELEGQLSMPNRAANVTSYGNICDSILAPPRLPIFTSTSRRHEGATTVFAVAR